MELFSGYEVNARISQVKRKVAEKIRITTKKVYKTKLLGQ